MLGIPCSVYTYLWLSAPLTIPSCYFTKRLKTWWQDFAPFEEGQGNKREERTSIVGMLSFLVLCFQSDVQPKAGLLGTLQSSANLSMYIHVYSRAPFPMFPQQFPSPVLYLLLKGKDWIPLISASTPRAGPGLAYSTHSDTYSWTHQWAHQAESLDPSQVILHLTEFTGKIHFQSLKITLDKYICYWLINVHFLILQQTVQYCFLRNEYSCPYSVVGKLRQHGKQSPFINIIQL